MRRKPRPTDPEPQDTSELTGELAEFFMSAAWDHAIRHVSKGISSQRYAILSGSSTDTESFRAKKLLFERLYEAAGLELPDHIAALFE